jgi:hypothetical protein
VREHTRPAQRAAHERKRGAAHHNMFHLLGCVQSVPKGLRARLADRDELIAHVDPGDAGYSAAQPDLPSERVAHQVPSFVLVVRPGPR